jgi:FkbM family methyltransferase
VKFELLERIKNKIKRSKYIDLAYMHTEQEVFHLKKLFKYLKVDIVFDIGANQGQYARMLREKVGYKGIIVSVEPIPEMVIVLNEKSKDDILWHIEPLVVTDSEKDFEFHIMIDRECSSLSLPILSETNSYKNQTTVVETIKVKGVTFESLLDKYTNKYSFTKNPYLKLDTQGYDLQILKASAKKLEKLVAFQSELSVKRLYESSLHMEDVLKIYRNFGFDVSAFIPNNGGHFPDLIEIDCIMIRKDLI